MEWWAFLYWSLLGKEAEEGGMISENTIEKSRGRPWSQLSVEVSLLQTLDLEPIKGPLRVAIVAAPYLGTQSRS
jgi:hypothetical protein